MNARKMIRIAPPGQLRRGAHAAAGRRGRVAIEAVAVSQSGTAGQSMIAAPRRRPGVALPPGAVGLGTAEAALVNAIWGGGAIDPATGRGASVGFDLHVFTKGAQAVSIWTDAKPVI